MEENSSNFSQTDPALQSTENQGSEPMITSKIQPSEEPEKPKAKNPFVATTILFALLALAGLGFGFYEMTQVKPTPSTPSQGSQASDIEVTTSDQYLINDLSRKVSILTGVKDFAYDDKDLLNTPLAYNEVENFFSRGFESTTEKAGAVFIGSSKLFNSFEGSYIDSDNGAIAKYLKENLSSLKPESMTESEFLDFIKKNDYAMVSYALANKIYSSMFNEALPKEDIETGICGNEYIYIKDADAFLANPRGMGCGGTGWSGIFVRKDSYKTKGDEAYVYVKVASTHLNTDAAGWVIYDDFYSLKEDKSEAKIIDDTIKIYNGYLQETPADNSFMDKASDYRFVFKKATNGTYYFDKLEKLE